MIGLAVFATVVLGLAAAVTGLWRRASAAERHLVWTWAFALLAFAPLATLAPPVPEAAAFRIPVQAVAGAMAAIPEAAGFGLTAVWGGVAALLLARLAAGYAILSRRMRRARPAGSFRGVEVRESPAVRVPLLVGLVRPAILLPEEVQGWPAAMRRNVLLHEWAHYQRCDGWAVLLPSVVAALYWPHPLVWWAARRAREEQERAADDQVLNAGAAPQVYAGHLVEAARSAIGIWAGGVAMVRTRGLEDRLRAILASGRARHSSRRGAAMAVALGTILLVPWCAAFSFGQKEVKQPPQLTSKTEPTYSQAARDAKVEGTVVLAIRVTTEGRVDQVEVKKGLHPDLDRNAMDAVRKWQFKPATRDGKPVAVQATVEVQFRLVD